MSRKAYPSDVSDEEWEFVAPYLTLMERGRPTARVCPARAFQRVALVRARGLSPADAAQRSATLQRRCSNRLYAG